MARFTRVSATARSTVGFTTFLAAGCIWAGRAHAQADHPSGDASELAAMVNAGPTCAEVCGRRADAPEGGGFDCETGAAIVVGVEPGRVYLVTAFHVVEQCLALPYGCVKVQLAFDKTTRYPARIVDFPRANEARASGDKDGDVADTAGLVVEVPPQLDAALAGLRLDVVASANDTRPGSAELTAIGQPEGVCGNPIGYFARIEPMKNNPRPTFAWRGGAPAGLSGGPMVDHRGRLVGMCQLADSHGVTGASTEVLRLVTSSVRIEPFPFRLSVPTPRLELAGTPDAEVQVQSRTNKIPGTLSGLAAGTSVIRITAPGHLPVAREVPLSDDAVTRASYKLVKEPSAITLHSTLYVAAGAAFVGSVVTAILALHGRSAFPDDPSRSAYDDVGSYNHLTDGLFFGSVALAAAGAAVHYWRQPPEASRIDVSDPR